MYIPTDLSITGPQLKKLILNGTCQISKDGLQNCNSRVLLNKLMHDRVEKARKSGRGVRLVADIPEIRQTGVRGLKGSGMSATGFWGDAWNWVRDNSKKAYNWIKDEAVPWVKSNVIDSEIYQNEIRPKLRNKLEDFAESKGYANYTVPAIEYLGDKTGAFGLKKPKAKCGGRAIQQKQKKPTGGSFRPTGY